MHRCVHTTQEEELHPQIRNCCESTVDKLCTKTGTNLSVSSSKNIYTQTQIMLQRTQENKQAYQPVENE